MKNNKKENYTSLDVAKLLNVEDRYLTILNEQETKENFIESELNKTEENFFNDGLVEMPK